jgi:hypothetical protein
MTFRDELIEAGAREDARHEIVNDDSERGPDGRYGWFCACGHFLVDDDIATQEADWHRHTTEHVLDAMLAHRSTVECPTCGGTGDYATALWLEDQSKPKLDVLLPCPAGCIDGRVPRPERLAVVGEQIIELPMVEARSTATGQRIEGVRFYVEVDAVEEPFILAPDLPEGTET